MGFCTECGAPLMDGMKFCPSCGKNLSKTSQGESTNRNYYEGKIRKCPNCGNPLTAFSLTCKACGYDIQKNEATTSIKEFTNGLSNIEHEIMGASNDAEMLKIVEKKAEYIRSYVIPPSKVDIYEFMVCDEKNIDYLSLYGRINVDKKKRIISEAWYSQFKSLYAKAQAIFGNEEDFSVIESVNKRIESEINEAKKKSIFGLIKFFAVNVPVIEALFFIICLMVYLIVRAI